MQNINWANYTGEDFQLFCNALLSFEIGKQFKPFNAPGKDYGIDGTFDGIYNNSTGKWRFQYKFHKVARKQAVSLLKADFKGEMDKHQEEDHFVLITNVELLPQELQEFYDMFPERIKSSKIKSIEIWDGAKIFSLYLQFPLLKLWLTEGFSTAVLLDYKVSFQKYLHSDLEAPYTLGNYFIAREDKLLQLNEFYQSKKSTAIIIGEAGIGKTRLIVEFFKRLEQQEESATCLVLMSKNFDFDKVKLALSGNNKIVILVDDAHEYPSELISDMITVCKLSANVKLLLVSRQLQFHNSFKLVKEYEKDEFFRLDLHELSREDTKALFKHELSEDHYLASFLPELTEISHGKPILIVLLLKAAINNTPIADIKTHDFLISYVSNYFNSFCKTIIDECQISKIKSNHLLQTLCLIEPVNYSDKKLIDKIASFHQLDSECVTFFLQTLKDNGFVSGRYEYSIKPDYYSDIYLRNASKDFIEKNILEFPEYLKNIIVNLSSVDEVLKQDNSVLDEVLLFYISQINNGNTFVIKNILDTVLDITYVKPEIATKAVSLFINGLRTPGHSLSEEYSNNRNYFLTLSDSGFGTILRILVSLLHKKEYYSFVYTSIFNLNEVLQIVEQLTTIFKFSKTDFIEKYQLARQLFFVDKFSAGFKDLPIGQCQFGIECCNIFLIHDFESTSWEKSGTQITITTYFIPNSPKVKKLRKATIELLFHIYRSVEDINLKRLVLGKIIDVPRGILATKTNKTVYKGDDEIESVLQFIKAEAYGFHFSFQKELLDRLYWYRRWGIDPRFYPLITEIKSQLKPVNFTENLIHLFSKSEATENFRKAEDHIKEQSNLLIGNNSPNDIADGLRQINTYHNNEFHYFHLFIVELTDNFVVKAQQVYNILWENDKVFLYRYGANFLQSQYFKHKQGEFYWSKVADLLNHNDVQADDTILLVYGFYQASRLKLSQQDLDLIEKIFLKRNSGNNFSLARALVPYLVNDTVKGVKICKEFLNECSSREAEIFFLFLYDNIEVIYSQLKELFLDTSVRLNLDYNTERCFNEICKREGIVVVLAYLIKRFEYKRASLSSENRLANYDFLPDGEHSHLFDGVEEAQKYQLFENALNWYTSTSFNPLEQLFAVEMLDYLKHGANGLNSLYIEIFNKAIGDSTQKNQVTGLLEALASFHHKDENLIDLVVRLYTLGLQIDSTDTEYIKDLNFKAYAAITTLGVKSGTAGLPFQVDIDLKDLITVQIKKYDASSAAFKLLESVLKYVERDISDSHDRFNETW